MIEFKKLIPVLCLVFSVILAVSSIYAPWWGIWNSKENQISTNNTKIAYYMPLQTIVAKNALANVSITLPFGDIAENESNKSALSALFTTTLELSLAGIVLQIVAIVLALIAVFRKKTIRFTWIICLIGALLLFTSLVYIMANMPATLTKFASVVPPELGTVTGRQISAYWGFNETWVWGAGYGWVLLFVSFLLCAIGSLLMRKVLEKTEV